LSHTFRVFADYDIWNVRPDEGSEEFSWVPVVSWSNQRFELRFNDGGNPTHIIFEGNFSANGTPATLGEVSGHIHTLQVFVNGVQEEYKDWAPGFDVRNIVNYHYDAEMAALSGDDLFVGSLNFPNDDAVQSLGGNDIFIGYGDSSGSWGDVFYGGAGTDTAVYRGNLNEYQVRSDFIYDLRIDDGSTHVPGLTVRDSVLNRDGYDQLNEVERLQFNDINLAFDINGVAGQAYRLYKAAFNRQPDEGGLGYWINELDSGYSLLGAAYNFQASEEFVSLYGENISDAEFINTLYLNVLHRAADQEGYDYWLGELAKDGYERAHVLREFSDSAENRDNVIDLIANGIRYEAVDPISA